MLSNKRNSEQFNLKTSDSPWQVLNVIISISLTAENK